ncbi:response regulator [Paragemmobacter ruber]|uniref:histidine kinase n=1 Tax=Paragemmobacter ruber TaxID=1985673 RepID=A0ABW9Y926_9RHOB|nr:response regulator [Rhodobacter ruber]NBE09107.1 response regulator [Rhodobacter ruber]
MSQFFDEVLQESRIARAAVRIRQVVLALVILVTLAVMANVFLQIDHELERSSSVNSDNATWTMAQVEVDTLKLQRAILVAMDRPGDPQALDDLRLAFDIFYSRFNVLAQSGRLEGLPINNSLRSALWADGAFFDRVTPLMDGDDAALATALPAIRDEMNGVAEQVRTDVVQSLQALLASGDARRGELRRSLQIFAASALGLLALMAALSVVIVQQNRAQARRAQTTVRAVHNLRAVIESSLDALVICDALGRITDCNGAAEGLFGRRRDEFSGLNLGDMLSKEGLEDPFATLRTQFRDGAADLQDGRLQMIGHRRDATTLPIEVALAEAMSADGAPMFIAFIRDISERIEREESLRKARNDALKGEEAKARFLAVMSHEMRTPLNGLIAATELLQTSTDLDKRQAWLSDIVLSCGTAALDQVNNVLELTRLGANRTGGDQVTDFSPVQVVRDLVTQHLPHAGKRGNRLVFEEPADPIPRVTASQHLFLRALYNLLGNAIKFTDAGSITVSLRADTLEDGRRLHLAVDITDTGIGIAEQDLERIFHNFETLDSSFARMRDGTGLGLGIAKLSAEAMGGAIRVVSTLGKGSTFTLDVTLPVAVEATRPSAATPPTSDQEAPALHILVVEDNPINSLLLSEMLRLRGHTVSNAVDGVEAVEKAETTAYDMILTDISMPRMDGIEATRRIRAHGACRTVPIIGVTANAIPERMPEFLSAGMTDVLAKPVTRSALMAVIATHARGAAPAQAIPAAPPAAEPAILNLDVLREAQREMGAEFVDRIASRLLNEADALMIELEELGLKAAFDQAAKAAHKSAGAAASIGLAGLHAALLRYETAAQAGDAPAAATALTAARKVLLRTVLDLRDNGVTLNAGPALAL